MLHHPPPLLIHASSSCSLLAIELSPEVDRSIPTRAAVEGAHRQALLSDNKTLALKRGALPRSVLLYSIRELRRYTARLPPGVRRTLP